MSKPGDPATGVRGCGARPSARRRLSSIAAIPPPAQPHRDDTYDLIDDARCALAEDRCRAGHQPRAGHSCATGTSPRSPAPAGPPASSHTAHPPRQAEALICPHPSTAVFGAAGFLLHFKIKVSVRLSGKSCS